MSYLAARDRPLHPEICTGIPDCFWHPRLALAPQTGPGTPRLALALQTGLGTSRLALALACQTVTSSSAFKFNPLPQFIID